MLAGPEDQEEILDSVSSMSAQDDRCKQLDEQSELLFAKAWARLEDQEGRLATMSSKMSAQDERVRQLDDRSAQARDIFQQSVTEELEAMRQEIKLLTSGRPVQMTPMPGVKGTDASRLAATEKELKQLAAEVRALRNGYEATSEVREDFSREMRDLEGQTCTETVKAIEQAIVELRAANAKNSEVRAHDTASPRLAGLAAEVGRLKTSVEDSRAEVKAYQDNGKLAELAAEVKLLRAGAEATAELRHDLQEALQTEIRTVMEKDNKRNDVIIEQLMEVTNKVVEEEHSVRIELTGRIDVLEDAVADLSAAAASGKDVGRRSRSKGGGARTVA